ncbi:uncharacterized protein FIBRA_08324 [Fibroporia radiculosa]|uniref:DAGKc domain-containing protein n=1 Tax=Fibroporia radiculosa TaxID=599839 RepID=J4I2J5_9APHY|nr:uncharacterized protein FIBRA_08324 [Fibroporia radiculosa]CCM06077.1 predicted protein [Fibroporia radiculosa]
MPTLVVYNPVCGHGGAQQLFDDHVLPLLQQNGVRVDKLLVTERAGHAGEFITEYLEAVEGPFTIVLGSGDGTLHEIIETLTTTTPKGMRASAPPAKLTFALVPCGTANALYASLFPPAPAPDADVDSVEYKLQSVRSAFVAHTRPAPLTLALTTFSPPPGTRARTQPRTAVSAVVASTALHASILHDSEALRASVPGLERFKLAAAQNIARWYTATLTLLPAPGSGSVQVFDPAARAFVPSPDGPIVDLAGPFAYFLSTVNVDRLEPRFRVTPHGRDPRAAGGPTLDVVVLRPAGDPTAEMDSEETRAAFAKKTMAVMGGAYDDGAHTLMRYAPDGSLSTEGDGPCVVEYFRCGGWEWEPVSAAASSDRAGCRRLALPAQDEIDERAHLVCTDGDIHEIEKGGKASCVAVAPIDDKSGFAVFV